MRDLPIVGRKFNRIGQQVLEQFFKQIWICLCQWKDRNIDRQCLFAFLDRCFQTIAHFLDQARSVHRGQVKLQRTCVDLRDIEHGVHDLVQTLRPFGDASEHRVDWRRKCLVFHQHFGIADDRGQRCAKFMGGNADEVRFGLVEAFEVAVGFVEGAVGLSQLGVELDQVFDQTRVFERDRRLVCESGQRHKVVLRIAVPADLCAQGQQCRSIRVWRRWGDRLPLPGD